MKKLLILAVAAMMTLPAAVSAQKAFFLKNDGTKLEVDLITVTEKGDFMFKRGAAQEPMKKGQVKFAWIPKPDDVAAADAMLQGGKAAEAVAAYDAAEKKYAVLGWKTYCAVRKAESLKKAGKTNDAIALLEEMQGATDPNPANAVYLAEAQRMLGQSYLDIKDWNKAENFVRTMTDVADPNEACAAYLLRGDILKLKADAETVEAKKKEILQKAALAYFEAALLFEKAGDRPQALFKAWSIMKELNDARAQKFADILIKKYPNNEYTKQLK